MGLRVARRFHQFFRFWGTAAGRLVLRGNQLSGRFERDFTWNEFIFI